MTGNWLLDWATLAVSLLNFMLLTWLGLTVLLNADRRDWGVWLMSGGLLSGGLFFICHTAILGQPEVIAHLNGLNFWWHIGWIPVIFTPLAWYVVTLWYAGYWSQRQSRLFGRQRAWLGITLFLALALLGLFVVNNPIPDFDQIVNLSGTLALGNTPLLFMLVPTFMVVCIILSMDALLHPAPAKLAISEQARQRSASLVVGTTALLLTVSLLVAAFVSYIVYAVSNGENIAINPTSIAAFDLLLSSLIAAAVFLLTNGASEVVTEMA